MLPNFTIYMSIFLALKLQNLQEKNRKSIIYHLLQLKSSFLQKFHNHNGPIATSSMRSDGPVTEEFHNHWFTTLKPGCKNIQIFTKSIKINTSSRSLLSIGKILLYNWQMLFISLHLSYKCRSSASKIDKRQFTVVPGDI